MFSHDLAGGLFTSSTDAQSKNSEKPCETLFSVLNQLETLRNEDGSFHLKLCYPELGGRCNEWTQTSNPATDSTILDFKAITLDFPKNSYGQAFGGLGLSQAAYIDTFMDDTPNQRFWHYAIGAKQYVGGDKIPGPVEENGAARGVKKVTLFVQTPGRPFNTFKLLTFLYSIQFPKTFKSS